MLFSAGQVVYNEFLELFYCWKWLYESGESEPEQYSYGLEW